jgi:CheY-like chemotaxis protein
MSPEQARNREIDQRSDVFSAGVVLWEMLVGARLFRGRDQEDTIQMVLSKEVPLPSALNPEVPESVDRICSKALARDRNQRYQTMGALLGELSRVADSLPRRAGSRDLSVYMRRQFGTATGGFRPGRPDPRAERSVSQHSGFADRRDHRLAPPSSDTGRVPLGQILLQQGAINMGDLEIGLAEQRAQGGRIGEVLVSTATITDVELAHALATQASLPAISTADLVALPPPTTLLARFPRDAAETSCILPISADPADRSVRLAVSDPYDDRSVLEAKVVLGVNDVGLIVAPRSAIREVLSAWYAPIADAAPPVTQPLFDEAPTQEVATEELPPRVLLADADAELTAALADRVRDEGWVVDVAQDGKTARALIRETPPVVAYLDAALPGIDGYNLLLELRSGALDTAVFITSERGDDFRQAKALELGADDFLVKPLSLEIAVSKIRREMKKRASGARQVAPPVSFAGVSGSLEDMTVIDIVQSLELGRKTAHVVVQYEDGRQGILRMDEGELNGASTDQLRGPDAFYHLARPGTGLFRIEYRTSSLEANVDEQNTFLMIEAMRHLDEGTTPEPGLRARLPNTRGPDVAPPLEDPEATDERAVPRQLGGPADQPGDTAKSGPVPGPGAAGIETIPLEAPLGIADDLTLDDAAAPPREPAPAGKDTVESWVHKQLEPRERTCEARSGTDDSAEEDRGAPTSGTEVAKINLRRIPKPD